MKMEKKQIINILEHSTTDNKDFNKGVIFALGFLYKLKVPEKATLPREVAEWLEESRKEYNDLYLSMTSLSIPNSVDIWLEDNENVDKYASAWLYGYEIEEQLYQAFKPNDNKYLIYNKNNESFWWDYLREEYINNKEYVYEFTKQTLLENYFDYVFEDLLYEAKPVPFKDEK